MGTAPSTVGLVGENVGVVRDALAASALDVATGEPAAVLDGEPDGVVAVGESAVGDVVAAGPEVPIVPVDAGDGIRSVPAEEAQALATALSAGEWTTESHVPLAVAVDGEPVGIATFDVALVTAEAARISEYAVAADGERVDRARADGVVVATPAGSTGYARRIAAPVLTPGTGVAVAWIAPFRTDPDRWVLDPDALTLEVRREEATVDLHVDDEVERAVAPGETVTVTQAPAVSVAVLAPSRERHG